MAAPAGPFSARAEYGGAVRLTVVCGYSRDPLWFSVPKGTAQTTSAENCYINLLGASSSVSGSPASKSELIQKIAEQHPNNMARKDVKGVLESLAAIGYKELKKTGAFFVPGFAKFVVIKKPATKQRSGINPFTKEPTIFKAKPARKIIRARPVKAAKDAVS